MDLSDKTALVSGSTDGIGREIARCLAKQNANIIVNGRSRDKGRATIEELETIGTDAIFIQANINQYKQVTDMIEKGMAEFDTLDILIASGAAGSGPVGGFFRDISIEHLDEWLTSHFYNRIYLIKASLDVMIESGGGRIISLTSDAGRYPTPGEIGVGCPAASLMQATKVLAKEFQRWDITVNTVSLSAVRGSALLKGEYEHPPLEETNVDSVFERIFKKQTFELSTKRVAEFVTFLAGSDAARPLTGQTIPLTGGVSV